MTLDQEIVSLIGSLGFPIALSVWFMIRTEKVIVNNTAILGEIKGVIEKCQRK